MGEETFGQVLRRLRQQSGLSIRDLGSLAKVGKSYICELENDIYIPSAEVAAALDQALNAEGEVIKACKTATMQAQIARMQETAAARGSSRHVGINSARNAETEEDATNRRRLLQAAAGLGFASLAPTEALRQLIDLHTPVTQSIEDWELACADHLQALRTLPPAEMQHFLHLDLMAVLRQVERATDRVGADHIHTRGLYRALSALSTLNGNVLSRLGRHEEALRWWRTARHTADASRDLNLSLGVRATEAGHAIATNQRDPATTLALIDSADALMARAPDSHGAALMRVTRARTLSLLGRHAEAMSTLESTRDVLETSSSAVSIMPKYWRNQQLVFSELLVYSAAGKETPAMQAREQVITANPDYQYPTIARLVTAMCVVVRGGVKEGALQASAALNELAAAYRTDLITHAGRQVVAAVPHDQRNRPDVRDLQATLAIEA
ncbi:helix-turn-helix transcriptional regulator [Nonomuraea sp. NPDC050404]|uniref:helix-turn-helix domain-containing protein n=1 Tax=Nonomuraea sp. NPDC050404 TaxID=3155783 RepID=UPI0033D4E5DB